MAEELQSLLDKINEEGVRKAEAQRSEIIAAAEAEAKAIRAKAAEEAGAIVKEAKEEAAGLQARAESAVRQAARDILLELQSELQRRITRAVSGASEQALTPELMAGLIRDLAVKFAAAPDAQLTVLAAAKDVPALETALRASLAASFRTQPKLGQAVNQYGVMLTDREFVHVQRGTGVHVARIDRQPYNRMVAGFWSY